MSFPNDMLEHARHLLTVDQDRLEQVNLRRSVSASYYALFHLLTSSASSLYTSDERAQAKINRSFNHAKMKQASSRVANDEWSKTTGLPGPASPLSQELKKLKTVADAFVTLQEKRHEADYDLSPDLVYRQKDALDAIGLAQEAFECWEEIKKTDLARLYAIFLLSDGWNKNPR